MLQFSPYVLPSIISIPILLWLALQIWSRRPANGILPFVTMVVGLLIWTIGSTSELSVTDPSFKRVFIHVSYLGISIIPPTWLLFCLAYTGSYKWVTKRKLYLFLIEPVLLQIAMLTNPSHKWFWADIQFVESYGIIIRETVPGNLFWLHAGYSYLLLAMGCVVLIRTMFRSPQLYRGQMTLLLIAAFTPWVANVVFLLGLSPLPDFVDLTPLAFVITVLALGWSMYRFRLLDLIPIARDLIVENMEDAILVLDSSRRIVDANGSALHILARTLEEVMGQRIPEVLPNQQALVDELDVKGQIETEIQIPSNDQTHYYKLRVRTLYNRQHEVSGYIVSLTDVTSLKEVNKELEIANEKAREATRLKSQFLATMSHELRTPLNAIIGYTELQLAGITGEMNDMQRQYQERVFANSKNLLQLINDILDLSKIEAGRMELIHEPFELQSWVDEVVAQNRVLADEKGLAFLVDVDVRIPRYLIGDVGRLRQILVNLLSNAFKFTNVGHVKLSIRQQSKNTWAIIVEDTGIGIPPHKLETIFDEFHQVDNSSTREYGGTGLGLAIVRKLAMTTGGNIRVSSVVGEGSQFIVTLPLEIADIPEADLQKI